ncbi:MAG: transposase [Gammaproteobacteria bacterium]|nr:transposase [Gammaproteobacteria bacterium]
MSQYKRHYEAGAHYFFTLATYQRRPIFIDNERVESLRAAIRKVKKSYPFFLEAMVVLPDHLHCLWRLPENDVDFSVRWRLIKRYFSMGMSTSINDRMEKEVWQRRFWEHCIRNEYDWQRHMDYIHYNPVKHGLALSPADWPHSSFNHYVEKGFYEKNWGKVESVTLVGMGVGE